MREWLNPSGVVACIVVAIFACTVIWVQNFQIQKYLEIIEACQ